MWHRFGRDRHRRERGLINGEGLLRPALELAVAVARLGAATDPPADVPRALQRIVGFTRLPGSALATVRRVLDEDDDFRTRVGVLAAEDEEELGRAAWLFLVRPDGWEEEFGHLVAAEAETSEAEREAQEERTARRRLRGAEQAGRRAEEHLARTAAELAEATRGAAQDRKARKQAETDLAQLQARVGSLERERDAAHRRASQAATESAGLRAELEAGRVAGPRPERPGPEAPAPLAPRQHGPSAALGPEASVPASLPAESAPDPVPAPGDGGLTQTAVRSALHEAAEAAASLGAALSAAARALAPSDPDPAAEPAPRSAVGRRSPSVRIPAGPAGRLPVPLPPGLLDDGPRAAEFLVRVPNLLLIVDGYNASLRRWPQYPIAEQRQRLVDAVAALSARCGADIHVVFDGAGAQARSLSLPRRGVRVTFSREDVEADEVILDLVDLAPPDRPVAAATDDRRVQREAGARGANVLTQRQLFSVLGFEG